MPKTLAIVRHGKSTWEYTSILDIDRPLIEPGIIKTIMVARKLKENKIIPGHMISSPANRALHTAFIMARELSFPLDKIAVNTKLYHDSEDDIIKLIRSTDDSVSTLFIFGHNPTFTILSNIFLKEPLENLSTSGTVVLEFDTNTWATISMDLVKNESIFLPKKI